MHIWPRGNHMLIALPNIDGTFACILFLPFEGADSFAGLTTREQVVQFFESRFPDVIPLMPATAENYFANPIGADGYDQMLALACGRKIAASGRCGSWHRSFFWPGPELWIRRLYLSDGVADRDGPDWGRVFSEFENARKINTDAIADLAIENFAEMRDRVADSRFLFRKKVELALEQKYPKIFVPKYAMVTFHRLPYSVALTRGAVQDRMLEELCEHIDRVEDLGLG